MRKQNDLAAFVGNFGDARRRALDARCVGDHAILNGDVQIDAKQNTLSLHVDLVERAKSGHGRTVREACPSPRPYPPCDSKSPTHCHTTTSHGLECRSPPWSDPCGTWTNADHG